MKCVTRRIAAEIEEDRKGDKIMDKYVWIVWERGLTPNSKEYLFGVFSTEAKQIKACKDFVDHGDYRVEKVRLDP